MKKDRMKTDGYRKWLVCLLSALSILYMTGCGRIPTAETEQINSETKTYVIGISFPTTALAYREAMKKLAETAYPAEEKEDGIELWIYDANGSQEQQNRDILEMAALGVDGIVLIPNTMEGCLPAVEYANEKGVPVITVDNRIRSTASSQEVSFVGADHASMGRDAAQLFLRLLEEKYPEKEVWNVIQLTGIADSSGAIDRGRAITDMLEQSSRVRLLGNYDGEFSVTNARCVMESCLQIYNGIDGVICQNDNMAEGCYQAILEAGMSGQIVIVGIDGQKSTVEKISEGGIDGTVFQNPSMILTGIEYLCNYLDGAVLEKEYFEPTDMIDKTNAEYYLQHDLSW